jgi:hypothetical protein
VLAGGGADADGLGADEPGAVADAAGPGVVVPGVVLWFGECCFFLLSPALSALVLSFFSAAAVTELVASASAGKRVLSLCDVVGTGDDVAVVSAVAGEPSVVNMTPPATRPDAAATPSDSATTRGEIDPIGMCPVFPRSDLRTP